MAETDLVPTLKPSALPEPFFKNPDDARKAQKDLNVELVRRLMLRGITSATEIDKNLRAMDPAVKLTARTIYRYKGIIMKRNQEEVRRKVGLNQTAEEIAHNLKQNIDEVSRESWKQYHAPNVIRVKCPHCEDTHEVRLQYGAMKVQALKLIKENNFEWLKTLQSLGMITTAPTQHQMLDKDGNPIDPPTANFNIAVLNEDFNAFIKAKYQEPVGVIAAQEVKGETS